MTGCSSSCGTTRAYGAAMAHGYPGDVIESLTGFVVVGVAILVGWIIGRIDLLGEHAKPVLARLTFFVLSPFLLFVVHHRRRRLCTRRLAQRMRRHTRHFAPMFHS